MAKTINELLSEQENLDPVFRQQFGVELKRCPFCGEIMCDHTYGVDNLELYAKFDNISQPVLIGCSRCIETDLRELNVPDGFVDFKATEHKDAYDLLTDCRRRIAKHERMVGHPVGPVGKENK